MPVKNVRDESDEYRHEWYEMPSYNFTWEAICPITNRLIERYRKPTVEEMYYPQYRNTTEECHRMNFEMYIAEPLLLDNGEFSFRRDLEIVINDGDDMYWHKQYDFTMDNYDEILRRDVLPLFELLKLAKTQEELIDAALSFGFVDF